MPKKRPSKPSVRKASVAAKTIGPGSQSDCSAGAVEPGDSQREDRSAADAAASSSDAKVADPVDGSRLTVGWAEQLGKELARADIEENGKAKKKIYTRSPEMRMKMKLAQRARRAREHGEVRR